MRVKKEKYLLTEVANEFIKEGLGNELTLFECIREEQLRTHIMYPVYYPRPVVVPRDYWGLMLSVDFDVTSYKDPTFPNVDKIPHQQAYTIKADFAKKEESEKIQTILEAIVARDTSLIHEEYKEALSYAEANLENPTDEDWRKIVTQYGYYIYSLDGPGEDNCEIYPVYIFHDDWVEFNDKWIELTNPIAEATKQTSGRKEEEYWNNVYRYVIADLLRENKNSALLKNRTAYAEKIAAWAAIKFGDANKAPKKDTIFRKLDSCLKEYKS